MPAKSKRSRKPQTRGKKTRDTLSYKQLDDLCRNLDYEGMMRHKEQVIEHLQQHEDLNDSIVYLYEAAGTHSEGLARLDKILRFALSGLEGDARESLMNDFARDSSNCENVAVLNFLNTSGIVENYWERVKRFIREETHVYPTTKEWVTHWFSGPGFLDVSVTAIDWAVKRDPSLLPHIFEKLCDTADVEAAKRYGEDFARFFRGNRGLIGSIMNVSHSEGQPECAIEFLRFVLSTADGRTNRDMHLHCIAECAVMGGTEEVLDYLADEENAWSYLKDRASDDVPCMCYDWFVERDPTLLPHMFIGQYSRTDWNMNEHLYWARLFERYMHNPKPRTELIQKIGAILDEYTAVIKENDYRVCMNTLMKLM